jgi:hypothetical protein
MVIKKKENRTNKCLEESRKKKINKQTIEL